MPIINFFCSYNFSQLETYLFKIILFYFLLIKKLFDINLLFLNIDQKQDIQN
jgi:hypothetical protein